LPLAQQPSQELFLIARSTPGEPPLKMTATLENAERDFNPENRGFGYGDDGAVYPTVVTGVWLRKSSMDGFLRESAVAAGAGSIILALSALGIYGVVGLMVATRTRELAVRVALGASRRRVLGMVLFDVVKLVLPGVVVGLILTAAFIRLNGEKHGHPAQQRGVPVVRRGAAVAVLVAVVASLAPARRAASVQPMVACARNKSVLNYRSATFQGPRGPRNPKQPRNPVEAPCSSKIRSLVPALHGLRYSPISQ